MLGFAFALLLQSPAPTPAPAPTAAPASRPTPASRPAHAAIPTGIGNIDVDVTGATLEVFTYKPASYRGERMLLVFHGVNRNADEYRDHARGMGDRFGALVVAPKFDAQRFPSERYQRGGITERGGKARPPAEWTFARVPELVAEIRRREGRERMPFWIIGHSAGGQFVMRMAAFQATGAERLVAANPGSDLLPTRAMPFGYGFGDLPDELSSDAVIRRYLEAPLTIYLGTADDHPDDNFDASPNAMRQGAGRLQRGRGCFAAAESLARERGWTFAWRLVEAEGIEHDHEKMFDHAQCSVALFGAPAGEGSDATAASRRSASRPDRR